MNFYIYLNEEWKAVQVEVGPTLIRAFDTTNDSFSCVLKFSTQEEPIKPMTPFKIKDNNDKESIMWIINDSVSIASFKPLTYKHSLSLVQYRYFLNKHILRNTVFNQPRKKTNKIYAAMSNVITVDTESQTPNTYDYARISADGMPFYLTDKFLIGKKIKFKSAYYIMKLYGSIANDVSQTVDSFEIKEFADTDNIEIKESAHFKLYDYENLNNVLSDEFKIEDFGKQVQLTPTQIDTINTYLKNHSNVKLGFKYYVTYSTWSMFEDAFAQKKTLSSQATYSNITVQVHFYYDSYHDTWYDVIDTLLKQYRLSSTNHVDFREKLFNLPTESSDPELYKLLTTTYPPDTFEITQATFYEALMEIFRFFDAGIKFDVNKNLQIEYYNEFSKDRSDIKKSAVGTDHSDKNYHTKRITYYQNAVTRLELPKIPTRCESLGIPGKSDFGILLPYPIYEIEKICYLCSFSATLGFQSSLAINNRIDFNSKIPLDITYFIVNESIWTTLDKSQALTGNVSDLKQMSAFSYSRGSKFIGISNYDKNYGVLDIPKLQQVVKGAIARFYGLVSWDNPNNVISFNASPAIDVWADQNFSVDYYTEINGRLMTETVDNKYNGEAINNQSNAGVDLSKLGLNMLGESLKDGEPTLNATCELTNWDQRIKEGDYIIYKGAKWVANLVNYEIIKNDLYRCNVVFTKNFNALSLRVATDNQKRLTAISNEVAVISEDNIADYVYVNDQNEAPTNRTGAILGSDAMTSLLSETFSHKPYGNIPKNVDYAVFTSYYEIGNNAIASNLYLPVVKYGAGNCVCFEMQYNHQINAGNQLIKGQSSWWIGSTRYFSQACLYTDEEGWADKIKIDFVCETDIAKEYSQDVTETYFPKVLYEYNDATLLESVGTIEKLQYYKKPNEVFALNYEWCFLTLPENINDFFIGNAFINNNFFVSPEKASTKKFYLYHTKGTEKFKYSIMDIKGVLGENLTKISAEMMVRRGTDYCALLIKAEDVSSTVGSWALCDDEENIYFASNRFEPTYIDDEQWIIIYFAVCNKRMADGGTTSEMSGIYPPSGTITFQVAASDWAKVPGTYDIPVTYRPTGGPSDPVQYIHEEDSSTTAVYTWVFTNPAFAGKNMASGYPQITQDGSGSYTNTVVFYAGQTQVGNVTYEPGTFVAHIYKVNWQSGMSFNFTVTYAWANQTAHSFYIYQITDGDLVGANITSMSISPASTWQVKPNTIDFNANNGTFYGVVYDDSTPSSVRQYTITYTID